MTLTQTFVVRPIDTDVVADLRRCDDAGRAPLLVVDADGGSPVRCCLRASRPGEELLLVAYAPLRRWAASRGVDPAAYDEVGPVFVHPQPCDGATSAGYPDELRGSPRVMRAYDGNGRIVDGHLVPADGDPESVLAELLADDRIAIVHARALGFGCFTFAVERAGDAGVSAG
jgi:hypothetical protein